VIFAIASSAGCSATLPSIPSAAPIVLPLAAVAPDVWANRGIVVERERLVLSENEQNPIESWRGSYLSASGVDGGIRQVSGTFFVPHGNPPPGGWPAISLAHGTTGIDNNCGPSTQPNLDGYLPEIQAFIEAGYAVAFSDYEGLGPTGSHPYLEPRTEAFNIIDAVRALRQISPLVSHRWIAFGSSQGGQAAWSANELNPYYGEGLDLLGAVALSPAVNISGLADLVWTDELTAEQREYYPVLIEGLSRFNPHIQPSALLHGRTLASVGKLANCESSVGGAQNLGRDHRDLEPDGVQDTDALRTALRGIALPQRRIDKPMLVINGMRDPVVLPQWIESAVTASCDLGSQIDHVTIRDAGHDDLGPDATRVADEWIANRLAGADAPSNCHAVA
jgi:pimeloyl-ACP methyl ester carboxylesterase